VNQPGPNFPYRCATCFDTGCDACKAEPSFAEPWPKETWVDFTEGDLEQLVLDAMDELLRRGRQRAKLERWYSL
jgi:hypothetical protein